MPTNRFPLIINETDKQIQEIPSGDSLDLTNNDLVNVSNVTIVNNLTVGGNIIGNISGSASFDNVVITGNITGNLLPSANVTYNLGSSTQRWNDLWLSNSTIYLGNASIQANATSIIFTNPQGGITQFDGTTGDMNVGNLFSSGIVVASQGLVSLANVSAGNVNIHRAAVAQDVFASNLIQTLGNVVVSQDVDTTNLFASANIATLGNISGNILNISNTITSSSLVSTSITGNVTGNLVGNVTGTATNATIAASLIGGNSGVEFAAPGGNIEITVGGVAVADISTNIVDITGNIAASGNITGGNLSGTNIVGTLSTAAQPNVTSVGTLTSLSVTGNITGGNLITAGVVQAGNLVVDGIESVGTLNVLGNTVISGNLTVIGNTFTANVESIVVSDPILGLGSGPNGAPLTTNDGLDRGIKMFYYTDAEYIAFMGYKNNDGKLLAAANVSVSNNVVTVNSLGTMVVGTLESTVVAATGNISGNVIIGNNISTVGEVTATGNVSGGNLVTVGQVTATGNVSGNFFIGNGSLLSGIDATSIQNGNSNVRVVSNGGNVAVSVSGNANVGVFTGTGLVVTGSIEATNGFIGLDATSIANGSANVRTFLNGNVTVSAAGTANVLVITGTGANVDGTFNATGNITGGNIITAGLVSLASITKSGSNGVGNIGQSDNTFNTIFARATSALYADLAEMYTADAEYAPGTVLVFGGSAEVTASSESHSVRIAGVVSTEPAHVMNSGLTADHTAAVALMGRVPCRVVGNIQRGDCLASSDIPGVATALDATKYQPGAVIGKALEDYNSTEPGMIEAVVGRL